MLSCVTVKEGGAQMRYLRGAVAYFQARSRHIRRCWEHARPNWGVAALTFLCWAYIAITTWGPLVRLPAWARVESWPKVPLVWAIVALLAATLFVVSEGSYRLHYRSASEPRNELKAKVLQLGRDLFQFLREKGPYPQVPRKEGMSHDEVLRTAMKIRGPYVEAIHYGYDHKFKQRVINLYDELAEHGTRDTELKEWEINPPEIQNADRIRKIAERLFFLATKMDIDEETKGL